jgi:hypothetical protein
MPTPWQDVYSVVWGVLILRVVDIWRVPTRNPLSNTPGIASVGGKRKEKKRKEKSCILEIKQAGAVCICQRHTHALLTV